MPIPWYTPEQPRKPVTFSADEQEMIDHLRDYYATLTGAIIATQGIECMNRLDFYKWLVDTGRIRRGEE